jgi:hypothetical protein
MCNQREVDFWARWKSKPSVEIAAADTQQRQSREARAGSEHFDERGPRYEESGGEIFQAELVQMIVPSMDPPVNKTSFKMQGSKGREAFENQVAVGVERFVVYRREYL